MSDTVPSDNLLFGEVTMGSKISDISDLALLLKRNEEYVRDSISTPSLPVGDDVAVNTIVQLTDSVDGTDGNGDPFVAGHYYQYLDIIGSPAWYDITAGFNRVTTSGSGYYSFIDDSHVTFVWSDPEHDTSSIPWTKTEILLVYEDSIGESQTETIYSSNIFNECADKGGITVTIDDEYVVSSGCKFVAKYYFGKTASYTTVVLEELTT